MSRHHDYIRALVKDRSGIVLDRSKEYLVETRISPILREYELTSLEQLVDALKSRRREELIREIVEALTTNETSFFRDSAMFLALEKNIFPNLMASRASQKRLRIWSAACSTGQEPYSIALLIRSRLPALANWDIEIFATDINQSVITKAESGIFTRLEVNRGLPAPLLVKHFERIGTTWKIRDRIRDMVRFDTMNLTANWSMMGRYDLVFIRNVMIYFDDNSKREIFDKVSRVLNPDGYLILGGAETPRNIDDRWRRVGFGRSGAYQPPID